MRLFKDHSKEFEDLKEEVASLKPYILDKSDKSLIKLQMVDEHISTLIKQNDQLIREVVEIKQILLNQQPNGLVKEEIKIKETPLTPQYYNGIKLSKSSEKPFKYTEMDKDTYKFKFKNRKNNRFYHTTFTIFDVLLIKQLENENSWVNWSELSSMVGIRTNLLKEIIFNLQSGFFDKFLNNSPSFSKEYGILFVDGKKTKVPIRTAKYIVNCMTNSSNPMTTLLKLEKTGECSQLEYRLIGTNYLNKKLISLFKEEPTSVENNPQKRKEKGL